MNNHTHKKGRDRKRLLFFVLLIIAAAMLPWWLSLPLAGAVLLKYNAYEIILIGLFIDGLYGAPGAALFGVEYLATMLLLSAAVLAPILKRGIIFYT